ncbi:MAG TPA: response regulator, partial [Dongiaceae bacterium]
MTPEISGRVAFIDDEADIRLANIQGLRLAGMEVVDFSSALDALTQIDAGFPGVVVSDIRMPQVDGLELLRRLRDIDPDLPVILITGHGDIDVAVAAMRDGAYDFIAKPYPMDRLIACLRRALEKRQLILENRSLQAALEAVPEDLPLIGSSPAMARIRKTLRHIADADVDVLVLGETGTGKEVVANALHLLSRRK